MEGLVNYTEMCKAAHERTSGLGIDPRGVSRAIGALRSHGYEELADIAVLRLSEAAMWWGVGEASLAVYRALGAIDDYDAPMPQGQRIRELEALCVDLYTCHCCVAQGPNYTCDRACPFLREGAYFDGDDGCALTDVYERMERLGILPSNGRCHERDGA